MTSLRFQETCHHLKYRADGLLRERDMLADLEAEKLYHQAIDLSGNEISRHDRLNLIRDCLSNLTVIALRHFRWNEATQLCHRLLEEYPYPTDSNVRIDRTYIRLSRAYFHLGQKTLAHQLLMQGPINDQKSRQDERDLQDNGCVIRVCVPSNLPVIEGQILVNRQVFESLPNYRALCDPIHEAIELSDFKELSDFVLAIENVAAICRNEKTLFSFPTTMTAQDATEKTLPVDFHATVLAQIFNRTLGDLYDKRLVGVLKLVRRLGAHPQIFDWTIVYRAEDKASWTLAKYCNTVSDEFRTFDKNGDPINCWALEFGHPIYRLPIYSNYWLRTADPGPTNLCGWGHLVESIESGKRHFTIVDENWFHPDWHADLVRLSKIAATESIFNSQRLIHLKFRSAFEHLPRRLQKIN